ncbi:hypothetical protein ACIRYZ_39500 [Kitasatospora sp. NPDC101155]|uniref:hypothetical protein n=1 Tax=Kitasatospora sp. NPDC101155 TaxID=3364097 RepID=UPI00380507B3
MTFYVSDNGQALELVGDLFGAPDGFREVSAEEYHAALDTAILAVPGTTPAQEPTSGQRSVRRAR